MKRNLVLLLVAVGFLFVNASGQSSGMSAKAKKNLKVNNAIMKAYEEGDFSKMGDYIAADAIDHAGEQGDIIGLENIVAEMKKWRQMTPDMKATMTRSMADDEYVFTWSETKGTMNGKEVTMRAMDVAKFKDGKAVEHWIYMDPKDMMAMMPPPPPAPTDGN